MTINEWLEILALIVTILTLIIALPCSFLSMIQLSEKRRAIWDWLHHFLK